MESANVRAYPVIGGWQAEVSGLFMAAFSRDREGAIAAILKARERHLELLELAKRQSLEPSLDEGVD